MGDELKEAALYPDRPISINPVWQGFAVVNLPIMLATIATGAKRLGVPNEARTTFADWLNVVHSEVFERKFNITSEAMEIIKRAKIVPFSESMRAARLGYSGTAYTSSYSSGLFVFFGSLILPPGSFVLFTLRQFPSALFAVCGLSPLLLILCLVLFIFFGFASLLLELFPARRAIILATVYLVRFVLPKLPNRLSLITLTTPFNHFAASSFISIPKLYIGSGSV